MSIEADAAAYPHAAQLISVTREVTHKASGKIEQGCRYLSQAFALIKRAQSGSVTRSEVTGASKTLFTGEGMFSREDKCRLRNANAACILALLRTALITLARCSGYDSLKIAQEIFAHDPNKAIRLLCTRRLI